LSGYSYLSTLLEASLYVALSLLVYNSVTVLIGFVKVFLLRIALLVL
jgi:hypothetical protein